MHTELLLLALVVGALAVTWICRRLDVSAPLVLVVVGIGASFLPGVEAVQFDPNVVLLVVLTPLLYSAALESSYLGIRQNIRPIGLLAVGLPVFSALVVGLVAWWLVPGLALAAALVLGAVVAPPDAVSALSIGRRLGLPRRIMTILGGESLVNDATSLTLFRVFVAVAAGGGISIVEGFGMFLLAAVGGTAIGLAIGWVVHKVRTHLDDPNVESALGLVVPFAVYLIGELAHTSGVLAVVVAGLYLGYKAPEQRLRHPAAGTGRVAGERHDPRVGRVRVDRSPAHHGARRGGRHPVAADGRRAGHAGGGARAHRVGVPRDLPARG